MWRDDGHGVCDLSQIKPKAAAGAGTKKSRGKKRAKRKDDSASDEEDNACVEGEAAPKRKLA